MNGNSESPFYLPINGGICVYSCKLDFYQMNFRLIFLSADRSFNMISWSAGNSATIELLSLMALRRVASGPHLPTPPMKLRSMIMKQHWKACKTESSC